MKRILLTNTYYQLIAAMQLKYTIFKDDYVAVGFSDHSKNASQIVDLLSRQGIFDEIVLLKTKKIDMSKNKLNRFFRALKLALSFARYTLSPLA